jgi:type III secretion system YscQ/HrcQ family protein
MRVIRDSRGAHAFPFAVLQTLSRREARTARALAGVARDMHAVSGRVAESLSRCLGCHARITVIASPEPVRPAVPAGERQEGVAARLELAHGRAGLMVLLPLGLLARLTARIFSLPGHEAAPDRSVFEALAAILVLDVLAALGSAADGARLAALSMTDDFSRVAMQSKEAVFCLHLKVSLMGGSDLCTILLTESDLGVLAGRRPDDSGAAPAWSLLRAVRLPVTLACAAGRIPCGLLARMEAGDVLFPDSRAGGAVGDVPDSVWLALRSRGHFRKIAAAAVAGPAMRVTETFMKKGERMTGTHDESTNGDEAGREETEVQARQGDIPAAVRDLPVEVVVEAARIEMSIDEIASLSPGSIISLERPLSAEVTLTSAGSVLAYGVLVNVDDELGVQILKVRE